MKMSIRQMCDMVGSTARFIEAVKDGKQKDAQIFKDLLAGIAQEILNAKSTKKKKPK